MKQLWSWWIASLSAKNETTQIAIDSLATVNGVARNVAERLLTGRLAEEFFLTHSESLVSIPTVDAVDMRYSAQGYDFAVRNRPECAIEVKGLKATRGVIQFTDRVNGERPESAGATIGSWLLATSPLNQQRVSHP